MTMGQRIARKRKEMGLSQEALGQRLGVTRQAIYKWEADAALPEIEKLVNLSREFSVSVGWLLGEEDGTEPSGELTSEQLRIVEEIVGRYLTTGPDPENTTKHRRWSYALAGVAAVAVVAVFCGLFSRLDEMDRNYQDLQMSVSSINSDVNRQIYSITNRVESILESQDTLTAEQSAQVADVDYRGNTVTVSTRALPRSYTENMSAEFVLISNGEAVTVPGVLEESHAFTAQLTGPLSDDISVSVAFLVNDQRQTQLLEQFFDLYRDSFPDLSVQGNLWGSRSQIEGYACVRNITEENAAKISTLRLGLFRDQKLLAWFGRLEEQPGYYQGDWRDTAFFHLDGERVMEPDHVYCVAAVLEDQYGRERIYPDTPVTYNAQEERTDIYAPDGMISLDGDPANWDY